MLEQMDIEHACLAIEAFAEANRVDQLTGVELMVRHWRQLNSHELSALHTFMEESKR